MAALADPRLTPARPDLAAAHLRGKVTAERFADPTLRVVATATAPVTGAPSGDAPLTSELLRGERFDVYELEAGWAWGQSREDGYVGYAPAACLAPPEAAPTHRVAALFAHFHPEPDIKSRPFDAAPMGALLAAAPGPEGFLALEGGGFANAAQLAPLDAAPEPDWVAVAERFLGAPYLWGGRTAAGLDCSALIQTARAAAGLPCPRDSDMQQAAPGRDVARLRRGDLVFWRGHVGVMVSPTRLLHANAHHMATAVEPLAEAEARIAAKGGGSVTARRRWRDAAAPAPRRQAGAAR
jgi:cell wall-associated NlpC family hydrolase